MATGDIPVETRGRDKDNPDNFTLTAGKEKLTVRTGGNELKITVKSGNKECVINPVDLDNWSLKIEPV